MQLASLHFSLSTTIFWLISYIPVLNLWQKIDSKFSSIVHHQKKSDIFCCEICLHTVHGCFPVIGKLIRLSIRHTGTHGWNSLQYFSCKFVSRGTFCCVAWQILMGILKGGGKGHYLKMQKKSMKQNNSMIRRRQLTKLNVEVFFLLVWLFSWLPNLRVQIVRPAYAAVVSWAFGAVPI